MTASNPAFFIFQPNTPPLFALMANPVSGEMVETSYRLPSGMPCRSGPGCIYDHIFIAQWVDLRIDHIGQKPDAKSTTADVLLLEVRGVG